MLTDREFDQVVTALRMMHGYGLGTLEGIFVNRREVIALLHRWRESYKVPPVDNPGDSEGRQDSCRTRQDRPGREIRANP